MRHPPEELCRIAAQAIDHPAIDRVRTHHVTQVDACYLELRARPAWLHARRQELGNAGIDRALRRAAMLFDLTYARSDEPFAGWNSSFTQTPLPAPEMEEWVMHTLRHLTPLADRAIVEVGCGTGLLARPLAAIAPRYVAIDPSPHAVKDLGRWAADHVPLCDFTAVEGDARHLARLDDRSAGLIVINSVVQYFPTAEYLRETLEQCARVLAPGGHLFIGDVRNLDLLTDFHLQRISATQPPGMPAAQMRYLVSRSRSQDGELCLAPAFFANLPGFDAEVAGKGGRHPNEMNLYRYDVMLRAASVAPPSPGQAPAESFLHDALARGRRRLAGLRIADASAVDWHDSPPEPPTTHAKAVCDGIDSTIETALLREIDATIAALNLPITVRVSLDL